MTYILRKNEKYTLHQLCGSSISVILDCLGLWALPFYFKITLKWNRLWYSRTPVERPPSPATIPYYTTIFCVTDSVFCLYDPWPATIPLTRPTNFLPRGRPHRVFQNDCGMNVWQRAAHFTYHSNRWQYSTNTKRLRSRAKVVDDASR